MKKFWLLPILLALIVVFVPVVSQAQFSKNAVEVRLDKGGRLFTFFTITDSTENDTSKTFSLDGFLLDSVYGFGVSYGLMHSSTAGVSAMKIYMQGSFGDSNWVTLSYLAGTSGAFDSTETYHIGRSYLCSSGMRFPYYRAIFAGGPGNRSDCINRLRLMPYKRNQ